MAIFFLYEVYIGVMKINKFSLSDNNLLYASPNIEVHNKGCADKRDYKQEYNKQNKINEDRPAERVSLSGSERSGDSISFKGNPKLVANIVKGAISNSTAGEALPICFKILWQTFTSGR